MLEGLWRGRRGRVRDVEVDDRCWDRLLGRRDGGRRPQRRDRMKGQDDGRDEGGEPLDGRRKVDDYTTDSWVGVRGPPVRRDSICSLVHRRVFLDKTIGGGREPWTTSRRTVWTEIPNKSASVLVSIRLLMFTEVLAGWVNFYLMSCPTIILRGIARFVKYLSAVVAASCQEGSKLTIEVG